MDRLCCEAEMTQHHLVGLALIEPTDMFLYLVTN